MPLIETSLAGGALTIRFSAAQINAPGRTLFAAVNDDNREGSAVVPFANGAEGSTVFLPFRAAKLLVYSIAPGGACGQFRLWDRTMWSGTTCVPDGCRVVLLKDCVELTIPLNCLRDSRNITFTAYAKAMDENDGWGRMLPFDEAGVEEGTGDCYIRRYQAIENGALDPAWRERLGGERVRIYQLLPRLFGNINETRRENGSIAENGCGKFADISEAALLSIRGMGFTHIWLTGVLQQLTATNYSNIGEPADDPDLLKGLAGSPYAVKDCFDICPDYAVDPASRLAEFKALLERIHSFEMKAIVDFIPNHVARSYGSDIAPDLSFGAGDNRALFFSPLNNFFYLRAEDAGHGPPLLLPTVKNGEPASATCKLLGTCDGTHPGELDHGRVSGNNVVSWTPSMGDWYETAKLNYGFNFTTGERAYPNGGDRDAPLPDTWHKMDRVLAYWQSAGVDGFRCDMAHMIPPEFWQWAIGQARGRDPAVWFMAEAYNNDPAKVRGGDPVLLALENGEGNVMYDLLSAGFDSVYDDPSYKVLKSLYDGQGWANDLDCGRPHLYIFQNALRYAENHDEVRLASREWGSLGPDVGRSVSAILFGIGRGPVMLYHGQEVGEPASGASGFAGDNCRTTIFDYWCMPEFAKWVNGHRYDGGRLSPEQASLRAFYSKLIHLIGQPAFRIGELVPLNPVNITNEQFGRLPGETASGHWLYAFLRIAPKSGNAYLVAANLHPRETLHDVRIRVQEGASAFEASDITFTERLASDGALSFVQSAAMIRSAGISIPAIPPFTPYYFEISPANVPAPSGRAAGSHAPR